LQLEHHPMEESRVQLIEALFMEQTLLWFVHLFEKQLPILNNFKTFLEAFAVALGKYEKIRWATTKIRSLQQEARFVSMCI
jgi:predicted acetyltransferase